MTSLKKLFEEQIMGKPKKEIVENISELQTKAAAMLKEHVLKGICTYCGGRVFKKNFKTLGEKHDYHTNGMCKSCLIEMEKEPKLKEDLKWQN